MRQIWLLALIVSLAPFAAPQGASMSSASDEAAVRKVISDITECFNRRDARAIAAHYAEDADHIGVNGNWVSGKAQLEKSLIESFAGIVPWPRAEHSIVNIRFLAPDIAVVITKRTYRTDAETWKSVVTFVLKKANSKWWITVFQNTTVQ